MASLIENNGKCPSYINSLNGLSFTRGWRMQRLVRQRDRFGFLLLNATNVVHLPSKRLSLDFGVRLAQFGGIIANHLLQQFMKHAGVDHNPAVVHSVGDEGEVATTFYPGGAFGFRLMEQPASNCLIEEARKRDVEVITEGCFCEKRLEIVLRLVLWCSGLA